MWMGSAGRRADRRRGRQSDRPDPLHVRLPGRPRLRRRRRRVRDGDVVVAEHAGGPVAVWSLALGALCWIQPVLDQFVGTGNLGTVLGTASDRPGAGIETGVQVVAGAALCRRSGCPRRCARSCSRTTASAWPVRSRPCRSGWSWRTASPCWEHVPAHPRLERSGSPSVVALGAALVAAARIPVSSFGLVPQNYYWAWSLAAFVSLAVVAGVCSLPAVATVPSAVGTPSPGAARCSPAPWSRSEPSRRGRGTRWHRSPIDEVEALRVGRPLRAQLAAAIDAGLVDDRRRGRLCRGRSSPTTIRT